MQTELVASELCSSSGESTARCPTELSTYIAVFRHAEILNSIGGLAAREAMQLQELQQTGHLHTSAHYMRKELDDIEDLAASRRFDCKNPADIGTYTT